MIAKKNIIKIISAAAIIIIVAFFVKKLAAPKREEVAKKPTHLVKIATAVKKDVPIFIESFGNLKAEANVDVESQITGKIEEVHFKEGQVVKKGDLLFTIEPGSYQAQYEQAQAKLDADKAEFNLKKDLLDRNEKLYKEELISQQEYKQFQADFESAKAQIKVDESEVKLAKIKLDYCSITAPTAGITGKRQLDAGNIVSADAGPILVNIKKIDLLYVDFSISESQLKRVQDAMSKNKLEVEINSDKEKGKVFSGEVELLENLIDPKSGTISLRASVKNSDKKLWPGEFVRVKLILGKENKAVLVPALAVQLGRKGNYVFVVDSDNKAQLRQVTCGAEIKDNTIIKKGIKVGEKVVVSGQMGLSAGMIVKEKKE